MRPLIINQELCSLCTAHQHKGKNYTKNMKLTQNLFFPSLIGNGIHLQKQEVQHLTDGWEVIIWMPTNWTMGFTLKIHGFMDAPETGHVTTSYNHKKIIKKKRSLKHIEVLYFSSRNNDLQSTMGLYRRSLKTKKRKKKKNQI